MLTLSKFLENPFKAIFGDAPAPDALHSEIASLKAQQSQSDASLADLTEKLTAATAEVTTLKASLASAEAALATAKAAWEQEKAALTASVSGSAAAAAVSIIASAGHSPVESPAGPTTAGQGDVLAELRAIKDPAKYIEFYRKNKAAIDAQFK